MNIAKYAVLLLVAGTAVAAQAQPSDAERRAQNREEAIAHHANMRPVAPPPPMRHRPPAKHHHHHAKKMHGK